MSSNKRPLGRRRSNSGLSQRSTISKMPLVPTTKQISSAQKRFSARKISTASTSTAVRCTPLI